MSETREARLNIRRMDTASAREFWEFVQRSVAEWEQQRPEWSREIAPPEAPPEPPTPEPCEPDCVLCSGEACERHGHDPCACDTLDRHTKPPTPEPDVCDPEMRVQVPTRTVKGYRPRLASTPEPERPAARCVWTREDFRGFQPPFQFCPHCGEAWTVEDAHV